MKVPQVVQRRLKKLGWSSVRKFQDWSGLRRDGIVGPVTTRQIMVPRICGTPDAMGDQICKWPMDAVTWRIDGRLPGVSDRAFRAAADWASDQWNASCGISLGYTSARSANITMRVANLGGPGNTLADSQLPCGAGPTTQLIQRYDVTEPWYVGPGPPVNFRIWLRIVVLHELGHAIGISHLSPNGPAAIMQPIYNPSQVGLLVPDVQQSVMRYGEGTTSPPPPPSGNLYRVSFVVLGEPTVSRAA